MQLKRLFYAVVPCPRIALAASYESNWHLAGELYSLLAIILIAFL
jgi:hypothetical protein